MFLGRYFGSLVTNCGKLQDFLTKFAQAIFGYLYVLFCPFVDSLMNSFYGRNFSLLQYFFLEIVKVADLKAERV